MAARRPRHLTLAVLILLSSAICNGAGAAGEAQTPVVTARDAGARYGQALGAIEVCYGSKITAKAHALSATYPAADQDAFKSQTAKIFNAWLKMKGCVDTTSPNSCKVVMDKSCLAAESEIGPAGSAIPGLVEFAKH